MNILPLSKSAPLESCAFMILSSSSINIGINRNAIISIMAISDTGTFIFFKNPRLLSSPFARFIGLVVYVMTDEPIMRYTRRITTSTVVITLLSVMRSLCQLQSTRPSPLNTLNIAVNRINIHMTFSPLQMYVIGTLLTATYIQRNAVAASIMIQSLQRNSDIAYRNVIASFVLGSILCITELPL